MRRWLIGLLACFCFWPLTLPCAAKKPVKLLTDAAQVVQTLHASTATVCQIQQENPNACPLCGKTHSGVFGNILHVLHRIVYFLKTIWMRGNTL